MPYITCSEGNILALWLIYCPVVLICQSDSFQFTISIYSTIQTQMYILNQTSQSLAMRVEVAESCRLDVVESWSKSDVVASTRLLLF